MVEIAAEIGVPSVTSARKAFSDLQMIITQIVLLYTEQHKSMNEEKLKPIHHYSGERTGIQKAPG